MMQELDQYNSLGFAIDMNNSNALFTPCKSTIGVRPKHLSVQKKVTQYQN